MAKSDRRGMVTKRRTGRQKVKVSITVSPAMLTWVHERVGPGLPFGSISYAFESGIVSLMQEKGRRPGSTRI